jgi:ubiquilin
MCYNSFDLLMENLGKILKDDTTLEEYKIEDGVTVHLVKGKSASASASSDATASASSTTGAGTNASTT